MASVESANDDVGADQSGNRRVIERIHDRFNSGQKMSTVDQGALGSGELFKIAKSLVHSEKATTSGKWLLMNTSGEEANGVWAAVREQVLNGSLGPHAKIGRQGEFYMICIYTRDFTDKEDMKRVVDHLGKMKCGSRRSSDSSYDDNLVVKTKTISYKADIVTLWGSLKFHTTSITNGTFYQAKRDENNTLKRTAVRV